MNFSAFTAAAGGLLFSTAVASVGVFISWSILAYANMVSHPSLPEVVAVGFTALVLLTFLTTTITMGVHQALKKHDKEKTDKLLKALYQDVSDSE